MVRDGSGLGSRDIHLLQERDQGLVLFSKKQTWLCLCSQLKSEVSWYPRGVQDDSCFLKTKRTDLQRKNKPVFLTTKEVTALEVGWSQQRMVWVRTQVISIIHHLQAKPLNHVHVITACPARSICGLQISLVLWGCGRTWAASGPFLGNKGLL